MLILLPRHASIADSFPLASSIQIGNFLNFSAPNIVTYSVLPAPVDRSMEATRKQRQIRSYCRQSADRAGAIAIGSSTLWPQQCCLQRDSINMQGHPEALQGTVLLQHLQPVPADGRAQPRVSSKGPIRMACPLATTNRTECLPVFQANGLRPTCPHYLGAALELRGGVQHPPPHAPRCHLRAAASPLPSQACRGSAL